MLRVFIKKSFTISFPNQFRGFKRQVVPTDFEVGYNEKNLKKRNMDPIPHLLKKIKKEEKDNILNTESKRWCVNDKFDDRKD
jgi:hypothetical protein